jgi:hypothetical protein
LILRALGANVLLTFAPALVSFAASIARLC